MEESDVGLGNKWRIFIKVMQAVWEQGSASEQIRWEIIVVLPKDGGDYHGIGLLEPYWKVVEKIMVAQLALIKFHDCLHGRLSNWGAGTATIKAKLHQSLAWHEQCPLYQIYVDLKKAYDTFDREQMLNILQHMESGQRCWRSRSISGTWQNWCATLGVTMGSCLVPRGSLLRGVRSHLSCLMCVLLP